MELIPRGIEIKLAFILVRVALPNVRAYVFAVQLVVLVVVVGQTLSAFC